MEFMKGSEPFSFTGNVDKGVLLVHGFTSTPDSLRYLGQRFREAGYHVECPRLPGHCTVWQDIEKVTWRDWIAAEEEALSKLESRASKVYVMGLSLGGVISLYLVENHPELRALSIVNHSLFMGNPAVFLAPVLKYILHATVAIASDIKDPTQKEIAYDKTPVFGVHEMTKLNKLTKKGLSGIDKPAIIFKSREDHLLPTKNAPYTYDRIASKDKELVWLDNSYHVATMDYDKDLLFEKSYALFERS